MFTFIGGFALAALAILLVQLGFLKSIYDSFYHVRVFPEPGVDRGETLARTLDDARIVLDSRKYVAVIWMLKGRVTLA
jgi:uncharacterized membrane protein